MMFGMIFNLLCLLLIQYSIMIIIIIIMIIILIIMIIISCDITVMDPLLWMTKHSRTVCQADQSKSR